MPSRQRPDLQRQARQFAREISELLNGTVTHGIRLSVVMDPHSRAVVGNRVTRKKLLGEPVLLTVSRDRYYQIQLQAAVRRWPIAAAAALGRDG